MDLSSNRKCGQITYIKSPHNFWIRLEEYKNDYTEMIKNLQTEYSNSHLDQELNVKSLILGDFYCAFNKKLFEWHRCEAILINPPNIYINYIDIGQTDLVPLKSIKILKNQFKHREQFSIHCSLNQIKPIDIVWSTTAIDSFSKLVKDKIVTLTVLSTLDNVYNVDLFVKTQNISEQLIKEGVALLNETETNLKCEKNEILKSFKIEQSIDYDVTITCIYSPFHFYAQLNQYLEEFGDFEKTLQNYYQNDINEANFLINPQIGQICVAKYSEDDQWYRAVIQEIHADLKQVRVLFIDYGNEDLISTEKSLLHISEQFKSFPMMGFNCCLDGIMPVQNGFETVFLNQIVDFMYDSVNCKVKCKFLDKNSDDRYLVNLVTEQSVDITKLLIENKYALELTKTIPKRKQVLNENLTNKQISATTESTNKVITETIKHFNKDFDLKPNQTHEFIITHIETVSLFYVKLVDSEQEKQLNSSLKYFYEKKSNLPQPLYQVGNPCVYYDSDNKEWYRAEIILIHDDQHCLINFVDYGITKYVNITSLREIYPKFLETKCLAVLACLDGFNDQKDSEIDEQIHSKFKEIALNKKFLGKCVQSDQIGSSDSKRSRLILNLFDENDESVFSILVHNLDNSIQIASDKFKPVIRSKLEETRMSDLEISLNETIDFKSNKKQADLKESINFYNQSLEFDLNYSLTNTSINISHFENFKNFYAQINHLFLEFDSNFDEFQQSCDQSSPIKISDLINCENLDNMAVAARFYDDNLWYRARICDKLEMVKTLNEESKLNIEFIDYGNCQLTSIKDIVYLNKKFSEFKRSAFKCSRLSYFDQIIKQNENIDLKQAEDCLLYNGQEEKFNWDSSKFLTHENELILEIDDFIHFMHKLNLIKTDTYLDPVKMNERIIKQEDESEISQKYNEKTPLLLNVKLTSIENGLKYIYFNLTSSNEKLKNLEVQLNNDTNLINLNRSNLIMNSFYLINYKQKIYRSILISSKNAKNVFIFFLIDYGTRLVVSEREFDVFLMMPKYFKLGALSIHCRLTLADNIENVWNSDEKQKFFRQIQPGNEYKIKLISDSEPYIIEFVDEEKSIDFQFNQIISRLIQTDYESRTCLIGSRFVSFREDFKLCGDFLKLDSFKTERLFINSNESLADNKQLKFYIQTDELSKKFELFNSIVQASLQQQNYNELKLRHGIKKCDLFLSRTKSFNLLKKLNQNTSSKISKNWSRVKVKNLFIDKHSVKFITLFYIDYGLEDTITYTEGPNGEFLITDYQLISTPIQFKLIPSFVYECRLNKFDLCRKLLAINKSNEFVDSAYLNDVFNSMKLYLTDFMFKVDFTQSLLNQEMNSSFYTIDLIETKSNKNLIDLIIDYAVKNIHDYLFPCIISHVNSINDFYIQKDDETSQELLKYVQDNIQEKVEHKKMTKLKSLETNKICIAQYNEDLLYYRAKLVGFGGNESNKHIENFDQDLLIDVFFIDYGNQSQVKYSNIREITPDLVDRLPKSFALNCKLYNLFTLNDFEENLFNQIFMELFETCKFFVKFKSRLSDNKFDSGYYVVDLIEFETKANLIDILKQKLLKKIAEEQQQISCAQMTQFDNTDSSEDDKAIAESFNNDDTCLNNTTMAANSMSQKQKLSNTWEETALELKNYDQIENTQIDNTTEWNETSLRHKNYDYNDQSNVSNQTDVTLTGDQDLDQSKSELYSTANSDSIRFEANEISYDQDEASLLTTTNFSDEYITIKDCIISFMHSSEDLYLQESNFDERINSIQTEIDNCLGVDDVSKSNLCIAQYKEDQQFYRCKMLNWNASEEDALVEFIDYGNRELVFKDMVTKMSDNLEQIKPLAIHCCLGLDLTNDSSSYQQLQYLANQEEMFELKIKKYDLENFDKSPIKAELILSKNGVKITNENLSKPDLISIQEQNDINNDLDDYYKNPIEIKKQEENKTEKTSCNQQDISNQKKNDDNDNDRNSEPNFNQLTIGNQFKTSTQINLTNEESSQKIDTKTSTKQASNIDDLNVKDNHNESEVYFYVNKSDQNNQTLINHNETVGCFADQSSNWTINQSNLDVTTNDNKNLTVSRFEDQDSRWSINKSDANLDVTSNDNKNLTVSRFEDEDSRWSKSINQSNLDVTTNDNKNLTVSRFEDQDSRWSINKSDANLDDSESYLVRTINEQDMSVWPEDQNQSGFDYKIRQSKKKTDLDQTIDTLNNIEYETILTGHIIHVNSLDDFYFQAEDADEQLMKMKLEVDKCNKKFDKIPSIGTLCIAKYRIDEQYYRAKIIEIIGQQNAKGQNLNQSINSCINNTRLKLIYIDYGNQDYVNLSDVLKISTDLKYIEPLATKCSLGLTQKFELMIKKLNDTNKDTSELIKYFKLLTGKNKVVLKIRKNTHLIDKKLVDVFIHNENVSDLLMSEALACSTNQSTEMGPMNKIRLNSEINEFNSMVINLNKNLNLRRINLLDLDLLKQIDEQIDSLNEQTLNEIDETNDMYCLAPLSVDLIQKYKLNNSLGRVKIIEKKVENSTKLARCKYIDFDYENWVKLDDLVRTGSLLNHFNKAWDVYELNLKNYDLILKLDQSQINQLNEIFKLAINYEPETSAKLTTKIIKKPSLSIRLFDQDRFNLDINSIIEYSIHLMSNPFTARLTHLENNYSEFDCLNDISKNVIFKSELQKLYESTDLFYSKEYSTSFKRGELCLVEHSIQTNTVRPSDSILSLAEHVLEQNDETIIQQNNNKEYFRAFIQDTIGDKCLLFNLDSGKQVTISNKRIRILDSDNQSCKLVKLIPFSVIKAKLYKQNETNENLKQLLYKSRYFGESIKLKKVGKWKDDDYHYLVQLVGVETNDNTKLDENDSLNQNKYQLSHAKSLNHFFIQNSTDFHKQIKLIQDQIEFEISNKKILFSKKNPPILNLIYAVYSKLDKKYHRIRLLKAINEDVYESFYIDYGHVDKVDVNDLIQISEQIQSIAPQAICCRLNGDFSDNLIDLFKQHLRSGVKFQASIYKQFALNKNKIVNYVPLQADNSKPIEIVIHLFDTNENLADILNLKSKKNKLKKLSLSKLTTYDCELINFQSVNEFYLTNVNYQAKLTEMNENLKNDFFKNSKKLTEFDLKKGNVCVLYRQNDNSYKRALITDHCTIKSQLNIRVYLIDYGNQIFTGIDDLYELSDEYLEIEPICIRSTLDLNINDKEVELQLNQKFKSLISMSKKLQFKLIKEQEIDLNQFKYTINLTGSKSNDLSIDFNLELNALLKQLNTQKDNEKLIWSYVPKTICFEETKFPLNQLLKVQLTHIDTAKHFGVVLNSQNEKRYQFLSKFHQWHKENKKSLKLLINPNLTDSKYLGQPCAVSSVQISKWCRGLVTQCDLTAQMSNVYLIDYCKSLTVSHDRLYKIENDEFLTEPTYVHRCQLQDDQNQLEQFSKYIDLLKSSNSNLLSENKQNINESLNTSHLSIENFEIIIECLTQDLTPIQAYSPMIKNFQYTIKVNDIKRIKSPFPQSPHSILNNSSKIKLSHQNVIKYESFYDETTENILCSTYKEAYQPPAENNCTNTAILYSSNHPKSLTITQEQIYEADYQNDTFSAITESTRIQTFNDETNELTLSESSTIIQNRHKREQTSNWIKDLDDNNDESKMITSKNRLELGSSVRVRVIPVGFSPTGFSCQRLDLLNSYERLQAAMNDYYEKISNASKSLEKDKSDPRFYSMRSELANSMDEDKSIDDLFGCSFKPGDYCAAYMGKSWVRCVILDIENRSAHVECVDDGRTQHIALNKLEKLIDNFKVMPRFCIKCKFADLDSKKLLGFDLKAIDKFEKYLCDGNKEFKADVICVRNEELNGQTVYEVNLFMNNNQNVIDLWQKN